MIYFLYDILIFIAAALYLPFYAIRGRIHADILKRLGVFGPEYFAALRGRDVVWIHAVSVGEARAAESLIWLARSQWPRKKIVVSTVTPTGYTLLKTFLKDDEMAFYAPLDVSFVIKKFLRCISPSLLVIMETEIWPNLISLSKRRGVPVVVVNGRISDRSFKGYRKMGFFLRRIFNAVDLFCMQNEESYGRVIALGAPRERVRMAGNIKFDISADLKDSANFLHLKKLLSDCLLWVAGSTHDNEEEAAVAIFKSLRRDFASLRLLIAPRHVERADKIRRMIRFAGLEAVSFSGIRQLRELSAAQVVLVDTIGDLSHLYRFCDVAFVGGSLVPKGGHNPIEPALFGKPVLFGKHMENFKEIRDAFLKEQAALEIDGPAGLEYELRRLLASPMMRNSLGERAKGLLDKNRGAACRTFSYVKELIRS